MAKSSCTHEEDERLLTGTWVIDEVLKGYILKEVLEVWSYKTQKFDMTTITEGLFTAIMNKFIKAKQQASGWPKSCDTVEQQYIY